MDFVAVFTIGRQFPDKAIDLIDEACTAKIKRAISENSLKGAAVEPNDVAQVSILLTTTCVSAVSINIYHANSNVNIVV